MFIHPLPSSCNNEYMCYMEELYLESNFPSVLVFVSSFQAWLHLCQVYIRQEQLDLHLMHFLEIISHGALKLQELKLSSLHCTDPAMLHSVTMLVCNYVSVADLKWHLDWCSFSVDTIPMLEKIITWDKSKSMHITLGMGKENCRVLQTFMSDTSCVGDLDVIHHLKKTVGMPHGDGVLEQIMLVLQKQHFASKYPPTSVHLMSYATDMDKYHGVLESTSQWTPSVRKLHLTIVSHKMNDPSASYCHIHAKLLDAVQNNMHL